MLKALRRKRLIRAIRKHNMRKVEALFQGVEDTSIADKKGRSLLALAYNYNRGDLIEFLRLKGFREEMSELYNYAVSCYLQGNFLEAQKRFTELTGLMPTNSKTHFYLGLAKFRIFEQQNNENSQLNDIELLNESAIHIKKSLKVHEKDQRLESSKLGQVYYILGLMCYKNQDMGNAKRYIVNALECNPKNNDFIELNEKLK